MKKIPALAILLIAAVLLAKANPVYFGTDGIVNDKNSALAVQAFASGDEALLEKAVGVFDAFIESQKKNGLLHVRYDQNYAEDHLKNIPADVCNLGWGAAEAARMYQLLKEHGMEKPECVEFARKICDFCLSKWDERNDFVKYNWHVTGGTAVSAEHQCIDAWGGIMPADLYELSALTGNPMWERIARLMWANAYRLWTLDRLHNRGITLK